MRNSERRGSAALGWIVLGTVFLPYFVLAALWVVVGVSGAGAGSSGQSQLRDFLMDLMIWVLMATGAAQVVAAVLIFVLGSVRRRLFP